MEQTPPPPPMTAQTSGQINCQWCTKPMDSAAVRCTNCGKLRKDIYTDKIKSYVFCLIGGFAIAFSFKFFGGHNNNDFNNFNGGGGGSSDNTTGIILLIIGILVGAVGTYFYVKVSKQIKSWWWT